MIITRVEMTRPREVPFPVPLEPTRSADATRCGVSRSLIDNHTDEGLVIELYESLIAAHAMD